MNSDTLINLEFLPDGKSGKFKAGISFLEAARQLGLDVPAFCGGNGVCGRCKINVQDALFSPSKEDRVCLTPEEIQQGYRLACTSMVHEDCTIHIPEASSGDHSDILSEGETRRVTPQPAVQLVSVSLATPTLVQNISDEELLIASLQPSYPQATISSLLLPDLSDSMRRQNFTGTAVLVHDVVVDFQPPTLTTGYGLAVDLGTTTVVSKLVDLSTAAKTATFARLNSQRSYGEDVIGRISYASRGRAETTRLQQAIIDLLNEGIGEMSERCRINSRHIYEIVIAGNTVMQHLLLGMDAKHLAQMPYVPVFRQAQNRRASDLGLAVHPGANVYLLPIIGRFVGGDTSAMLLSLADKQQGTWLAVDIGTNGEMILAQNGRFWSTSAAAGPAFEGAHIGQGMRAGAGAIDRVSVHNGKLVVHVMDNVPAIGICGSGLIDAVGTCVQIGCLDFAGRLQKNEILPLQESADQGPMVALSGQTGGTVLLTQKDIREVQLAKSAIATAIQILFKAAGLQPEQLDALYLAGAFGQYIRKDMALAIGLLPKIPLEKIHFIGNAAYVGAELALCSIQERARVEQLAAGVEYVEVASDPDFQDLFAENLLFPDPMP